MTSVVCAASMASAFSVMLNLVCIWLLLIVVADFAQGQGAQKTRPRRLGFSITGV